MFLNTLNGKKTLRKSNGTGKTPLQGKQQATESNRQAASAHRAADTLRSQLTNGLGKLQSALNDVPAPSAIDRSTGLCERLARVLGATSTDSRARLSRTPSLGAKMDGIWSASCQRRPNRRLMQRSSSVRTSSQWDGLMARARAPENLRAAEWSARLGRSLRRTTSLQRRHQASPAAGSKSPADRLCSLVLPLALFMILVSSCMGNPLFISPDEQVNLWLAPPGAQSESDWTSVGGNNEPLPQSEFIEGLSQQRQEPSSLDNNNFASSENEQADLQTEDSASRSASDSEEPHSTWNELFWIQRRRLNRDRALEPPSWLREQPLRRRSSPETSAGSPLLAEALGQLLESSLSGRSLVEGLREPDEASGSQDKLVSPVAGSPVAVGQLMMFNQPQTMNDDMAMANGQLAGDSDLEDQSQADQEDQLQGAQGATLLRPAPVDEQTPATFHLVEEVDRDDLANVQPAALDKRQSSPTIGGQPLERVIELELSRLNSEQLALVADLLKSQLERGLGLTSGSIVGLAPLSTNRMQLKLDEERAGELAERMGVCADQSTRQNCIDLVWSKSMANNGDQSAIRPSLIPIFAQILRLMRDQESDFEEQSPKYRIAYLAGLMDPERLRSAERRLSSLTLDPNTARLAEREWTTMGSSEQEEEEKQSSWLDAFKKPGTTLEVALVGLLAVATCFLLVKFTQAKNWPRDWLIAGPNDRPAESRKSAAIKQFAAPLGRLLAGAKRRHSAESSHSLEEGAQIEEGRPCAEKQPLTGDLNAVRTSKSYIKSLIEMLTRAKSQQATLGRLDDEDELEQEAPDVSPATGKVCKSSRCNSMALNGNRQHEEQSSIDDEVLVSQMDISAAHLILAYMEKHLEDKERLRREWLELNSRQPGRPTLQRLARTALSGENRSRNNNPQILALDKNRVRLGLGPISSLRPGSAGLWRGPQGVGGPPRAGDYINASFIHDDDPKRPTHIIGQGPTQATLAHFWQMIWEQGVSVLVMLARLNEGCACYWPSEPATPGGNSACRALSLEAEVPAAGSDDSDQSDQSQNSERPSNKVRFEVHLVSEHVSSADYLVRNLYLINRTTGEARAVVQFHYLAWPELGVPENVRSLLQFRRKVHKSYRDLRAPILVHCSDGAGRSGTYALVDLILERIRRGAKEIDPRATLEHLREQRPPICASQSQFEFVLVALAEEIQLILRALPQ